MITTLDSSYTIVGPRGEKLYPSPSQNRAKYRNLGSLPRDMRRAVKPQDWAEMVTLAAKLVASDPSMMGAIRQRAEWAFAGDSWQPIFYGGEGEAWETWGEQVTDWLTHVVFPNAIRCNVRKDLIKAMQVSASTGWAVHGGDLALFSLGAGNLPQMAIIPGTRIGNGPNESWSSSLTGGLYSTGSYTMNGFAICQGGRYDGFRIYNGFIFDDADEIIAARVIGLKRTEKDWVESYEDFDLGFASGAHFASEYDWHGLGRPLPKIAASLLRMQQQGQIDENLMLGINNASRLNVTHKLAPGQDITQARGNNLTPIIVPAADSSTGVEQVLYVEQNQPGDIRYIGSDEALEFLKYENPHPNVEEFIRRMRSEIFLDLGWPYELTDLSSTGRAPTRQACNMANNSLWQTQMTGETRLFWFVKFAIAKGLEHGHIPPPPPGRLEWPYMWTFGYPAEMSVDQGNDIKAQLEMLRFGLTSQRISTAKWGYVLKRIESDRDKEVKRLMDRTQRAWEYSEKLKLGFSTREVKEMFYQPSANQASAPAGNGQPSVEEETTPPMPIPTPERRTAAKRASRAGRTRDTA